MPALTPGCKTSLKSVGASESPHSLPFEAGRGLTTAWKGEFLVARCPDNYLELVPNGNRHQSCDSQIFAQSSLLAVKISRVAESAQ
ncbi:hypothetical protein FA13DRAFT_1738351 [Coprinellus micaceus]|uniref:Uncharacterized protein n=1 Tax=Coprinellus micaceus TaxID=71717 RepID=A0A4Y7SUX5_COPMI|nr:hypothetical protein FA13DRAFT_1738351 [Coprinellus micaceus]